MESGLYFNQLRALTAYKRGKSVALLGGAGSGKSYVLSHILDNARSRYGSDSVLACAWNNQAAASISGRTVHNVFGVKAGFNFEKESLWTWVEKDKALCEMLGKIRIIVIDEVSVVQAKVLDSIDLVMRFLAVRRRFSCTPMGARQLIVAGDPFQLEPIGVNSARDGDGYFFSARAWFLTFGGFGSGVVALLNSNHRQADDSELYEILSRMRMGCSSDEDMERINKTGMCSEAPDSSHTLLCLLKRDVDAVNSEKLSRLPGETFESKANDRFKVRHSTELQRQLERAAAAIVSVKPGCDIILTRKVGTLLPGTRFTVTSVHIREHSKLASRTLSLSVRNEELNLRCRIAPLRFEIFDSDASVLAYREQLPVVSAYAVTVHRCQGLTLRKIAMDFRKVGTWVPTGMAYVALSRCTSMKGLWVRGLQQRHILVNKFARTLMEDISKLKRHFVHRVISSSNDGGKKRLCEEDRIEDKSAKNSRNN